MVKARKDQNLQYNDMLNNLIEVSKEHPEMTEEIMYKTCIQFFSDGYESAGMVDIKQGSTVSTYLNQKFIGVWNPGLLPGRVP